VMTPSLLRALGLFSAAVTLILFSGFLTFAMIGEINRKVPDSERISYLFGHPAKYLRILREYRRLYPVGHLRLYFHISFFTGVAFLVGSAWFLGFFR
jgi:hypothetical protein